MSNFKLKNYTTTVPAVKSQFEIERLLINFGASAIMKEFAGDGSTRAVLFKLGEVGYKLPTHIEGVYNVMFGTTRTHHSPDAIKNREKKASDVAWRILRDWVHAQLSVIASGQAQPDEVMLPYLYNGKQTLYEAYKEGRLQLPAGSL